jgi:hypothetical protein
VSEGYVAIAFDDQRYLDLAANMALSIRRLDTRPVSVVVNAAMRVPDAYTAIFDQIIVAPEDPTIRGAMNKARLIDLTPYDRTMYVDADCILFNSRIEFFWRKFAGQPFAVEGHRQSAGQAFACSLGEKDAAALCQRFGVPYLTVFNAGLMYFERNDKAQRIFQRVLELYRGPERDVVSYRYKHEGEYADEPYFAVALAEAGIPPHESPTSLRLQVTTPNIVDGVFDLDLGDIQVVKKLASGGHDVWAGAFCHFCGLAPMDIYFNIADRLRAAHGLGPMDRNQFRPVVLTATQHRESAAS